MKKRASRFGNSKGTFCIVIIVLIIGLYLISRKLKQSFGATYATIKIINNQTSNFGTRWEFDGLLIPNGGGTRTLKKEIKFQNDYHDIFVDEFPNGWRSYVTRYYIPQPRFGWNTQYTTVITVNNISWKDYTISVQIPAISGGSSSKSSIVSTGSSSKSSIVSSGNSSKSSIVSSGSSSKSSIVSSGSSSKSSIVSSGSSPKSSILSSGSSSKSSILSSGSSSKSSIVSSGSSPKSSIVKPSTTTTNVNNSVNQPVATYNINKPSPISTPSFTLFGSVLSNLNVVNVASIGTLNNFNNFIPESTNIQSTIQSNIQSKSYTIMVVNIAPFNCTVMVGNTLINDIDNNKNIPTRKYTNKFICKSNDIIKINVNINTSKSEITNIKVDDTLFKNNKLNTIKVELIDGKISTTVYTSG